MPHFYLPPDHVRGDTFWLAPEESAHVARVLRKRPGDTLSLFDGKDRAWSGVLERVNPERVEGRLTALPPPPPSPYLLRLWQGLPKGDAWEWVLEKGAELGVSEFVPVLTERTVGKIPTDRVAARRARWEKILRAASEQCGRVDIPRVENPVTFSSLLARFRPPEWTILPWEGETAVSLKAALAQRRRESPSEKPTINVMIGPEGGFAPREVEQARAAGAQVVTLGPRILRTETAGLAVAAALSYEFDH